MAERIVSPGVFTNEIDQSFLPAGIAQIGAAVVGPTVKGPALVPTRIASYADYVNIFGPSSDDTYVPYVVDNYLRSQGEITVTRLLYEDGYDLDYGVLAVVAKSGSVKTVTHVLHPTQVVNDASNLFNKSVLTNVSSGSFTLQLSGSYDSNLNASVPGYTSFLVAPSESISLSINSSANNYVTKVFGAVPTSVSYPVYVQYENKTATSLFANLGDVSTELVIVPLYQFLQDYNYASTPWITSQKQGSTNRVNLFRFHTLSHGTSVNQEIKVTIRDIYSAEQSADPDGYAKFTIELRRVNTVNLPNSPYSSNDTDNNRDTVEVYTGVNLNPNSVNYIAKRIGDKYQTVTDAGELVISGNYANISKFVRVDVNAPISDKTLMPFGFRALSAPVPGVSGSAGSTFGPLSISAAAYKTTQNDANGSYISEGCFGFDFTVVNNLNYLAPIPTSGSITGSNIDFYLGDMLQSADASTPSVASPYTGSITDAITAGTFTTNISISTKKFVVPFQGGFDGTRPNLPKFSGANIAADNVFGFNCQTDTSTGTKAYKKAFSLLSNSDVYDINMLVTPGVIDRLHLYVTAAARNMIENRMDTFYVMDAGALNDTNATVINQVTTIDSSYTATYWPWVQIADNGVNKWVPPSVVVAGVLNYNDKVSAPWYAPAGLTRGGLTSTTDVYKQLSQKDRDTLYTARINPIAFFPNGGRVIWGQKTLQGRPSALDRVNVRRLLIAVKKYIASSTRYLVFEQNTDATRNRFLNIVNPYLASVQANQGLYAFRVVMDSTNNTADLIDQNILYGQIFLQPTRTAEFILLDFNIQPTGAAFGQ